MHQTRHAYGFRAFDVAFVLIIMVPTFCFAFKEVLFVSWGSGSGNAAYRFTPSGNFGPSDFSIANHSPSGAEGTYLYLLDSEQSLLQVFDLADGAVASSCDVPRGSRRFACENGQVAVWDGYAVHLAPWGEEWSTSAHRFYPFKTVHRMQWLNGVLVVEDHRGQSFLVEEPLSPDGVALTKPLSSSPLGTIRKLGKSAFQIIAQDGVLMQVDSPRLLGAVQYLGVVAGHHCLLVEEVLDESPIDAQECLLFVSAEGRIEHSVAVPFLYFTELERSFCVHENGVYGFISSARGLHLLVLATSDSLSEKDLCFPTFQDEPFHYNMALPALPSPSDANTAMENSISRTEIMANAREYTDLLWAATAENLTDGLERLPDGAYVRTPSWVAVGLKRSVPYKWGGFTSVADFNAGVNAGKKCGDDYTESMSLTDDYCVGVDCSGFVSRCWGTEIKYFTATMHEISYELDSFYEMKKGDALNQPHHHIRLCAEDNPIGMVLIIESGADWRVSYRSKKLISLIGYTPIRFNEVIEEEPVGPFVIRAKESPSPIAVHREPSAATTVIAHMTPGQRFVSTCFHDGWYHLFLPSGTGHYAGWCFGGTTSTNGFLEGDQNAAMVRITAEALNLREGPGPEYSYVSTAAEGQRFALKNEVGEWREIEVAGIPGHETGWVPSGVAGEFAVVEPGGPKDGYGATVVSFCFPEKIDEQETALCTLEVTNSGCCSWDDDTLLRTTLPRGRSSLFAAPTWIDSSTVCPVGAQVLPYQKHTLNFEIKAPLVSADTMLLEHFGFEQEGYRWFGDASQRGPTDDGMPLCITIHDVGLPAPPVVDKTTVEISDGALRFSWLPVEEALYYGIFRGQFGSGGDPKPIASSVGMWFSSTHGIGDVSRNVYYRIRAYAATDSSAFSEPIGEFDFALPGSPINSVTDETEP